jgi:hypothetical protein
LNGVKYFKSHCQVILDRTGANDKEDIYSGAVRIDNVRIGFFLRKLYRLHVSHLTSEMPFTWKNKMILNLEQLQMVKN